MAKTETKITTRWTTIATVGYQPGIAKDENPSAHGAVCHLQARRGVNGLIGRKVNTNGRHSETSETFRLDAETLANWRKIDADCR
jgi:hypothetical protein